MGLTSEQRRRVLRCQWHFLRWLRLKVWIVNTCCSTQARISTVTVSLYGWMSECWWLLEPGLLTLCGDLSSAHAETWYLVSRLGLVSKAEIQQCSGWPLAWNAP